MRFTYLIMILLFLNSYEFASANNCDQNYEHELGVNVYIDSAKKWDSYVNYLKSSYVSGEFVDIYDEDYRMFVKMIKSFDLLFSKDSNCYQKYKEQYLKYALYWDAVAPVGSNAKYLCKKENIKSAGFSDLFDVNCPANSRCNNPGIYFILRCQPTAIELKEAFGDLSLSKYFNCMDQLRANLPLTNCLKEFEGYNQIWKKGDQFRLLGKMVNQYRNYLKDNFKGEEFKMKNLNLNIRFLESSPYDQLISNSMLEIVEPLIKGDRQVITYCSIIEQTDSILRSRIPWIKKDSMIYYFDELIKTDPFKNGRCIYRLK